MSDIEPTPSLRALRDVSMIILLFSFRPNKIPVNISYWIWAVNTNYFLSLRRSQMNPRVRMDTYLMSKSSLLMLELIFSTIPSHSFLGISMQQMAATILAAALLIFRSWSINTESTASLTFCLALGWRLSHKYIFGWGWITLSFTSTKIDMSMTVPAACLRLDGKF